VAEAAAAATRASGVLLHPTSLPGPGMGDLGPEAYAFVEWLGAARQTLWQLLPLVAVNEGGSPYNALSALAGNPLLLSPAELAREGWIAGEETAAPAGLPTEGIDFGAVLRWKEALVRSALERLDGARRSELDAYRRREADWLEDYVLFRALRDRHGPGWTGWPAPLRDRAPDALAAARRELAEPMEVHALAQLLFDRQWDALRSAARARGILVIGDLPIFVAHDSADVWARREIFALDHGGHPAVVSGVPPDYFSATGQLWGNPLYRWDVLEEEGYGWWIERFRRTLRMVDVVRIDHFRGFESYWEVRAGAADAIEGRWLPGPGRALFDALEAALGSLPLIAEDLGIITPEVERLRDTLELPGMRVLQFAFGEDDPANPHRPGNYPVRSVAYTGTHDNDTVSGWYRSVGAEERARADLAAGGAGGEPHWRMIEAVMRSAAAWVVFPIQDVLGLSGGARMNTPGRAEGNWTWRLRPGELVPEAAARLARLVAAAGRAAGTAG
jgi:4-alpha-glucanotransferase